MSNLYQRMTVGEKTNPASSRLFHYMEHTENYTVSMFDYNDEIIQAVWYLKDEMKIMALHTMQFQTCNFLESKGFPKGGKVWHLYDEPCRIVWERPEPSPEPMPYPPSARFYDAYREMPAGVL